MSVSKATRALVQRRAGNACEYCRLPQGSYDLRLQIEHITARQHHGSDADENLALACLRCNGHKGPNLSGIDPDTGRIVPLFHPRRDDWSDHFRWFGTRIIGLTPVGRATADVLSMNDEASVSARDALDADGRSFC